MAPRSPLGKKPPTLPLPMVTMLMTCWGRPVQGEPPDVCGDQVDEAVRHSDEPGVGVNQALVVLGWSVKLVPESRHTSENLGDGLVEWLHDLRPQGIGSAQVLVIFK